MDDFDIKTLRTYRVKPWAADETKFVVEVQFPSGIWLVHGDEDSNGVHHPITHPTPWDASIWIFDQGTFIQFVRGNMDSDVLERIYIIEM